MKDWSDEHEITTTENGVDSRYNDEELKEFRYLIHTKLENARKEVESLQAQFNGSDMHGTDDTARSFRILEDGSDALAKEEIGQLIARQVRFITLLENALIRIENKTYGICEVTGKKIPRERLKIVPHTTLSMEAKLGRSSK